MDKINWIILDKLSDDWESLNNIYPIEGFEYISVNEITNRIKELLDKNLIQLMFNIDFNSEYIISDYNKNEATKFWFGLTEHGSDEWEKYSKEYSGEIIDWNNLFTISYGSNNGYIEATTKELCEKYFQAEIINKGIKVIKDSIRYSKLKEVKLKYYKKISGG